MISKETVNIIDETISQMTDENDGDLLLFPNLEEIAKRAEVSMEMLGIYLRVTLLDEKELLFD